MLADKPFRYGAHLDKTGEVLFEPLIDVLVHVELLAQDAQDQGVMVGIKGDWGTGKTSILKALQEYFNHSHSWPVVFFDAWKYQEEETPILPLLEQLRKLYPEPQRKDLTRLMEKLATTGTVAMDVVTRIITNRFYGQSKGLKELEQDMEDALEVVGRLQVENYSKYDETFNLLREAVIKILDNEPSPHSQNQDWDRLKERVQELKQEEGEIPRCLLILVDDLDRLLPHKAVGLLEAIRFYLSLPRTVVVMGVNDRILAPALEDHYMSMANGEREKSPFTGQEFMEKLFHWSIELPHHPFNPSLHRIHFAQVLNRKGSTEFSEVERDLLDAMDPLPHRKWLRIANRWEALLMKEEDPAKALWLALFQECFPRAEVFLRRYPVWGLDFPNFYNNPPPQGEEVKRIVAEYIDQDTTYLSFPKATLERLLQIWDELGGQEL